MGSHASVGGWLCVGVRGGGRANQWEYRSLVICAGTLAMLYSYRLKNRTDIRSLFVVCRNVAKCFYVFHRLAFTVMATHKAPDWVVSQGAYKVHPCTLVGMCSEVYIQAFQLCSSQPGCFIGRRTVDDSELQKTASARSLLLGAVFYSWCWNVINAS